jgi:hypothetical protein
VIEVDRLLVRVSFYQTGVYICFNHLNCRQPFFPRVIHGKMQLHLFALIALFQLFANGNPLSNVDGGLAELEKRTSSFPNLVPTTTVNLKTDSTRSTQIVSPARSGTATVIIHSATTTTAAPSSQASAKITRVTPSPDNTGSSSLATVSSSGASSTTQNQGIHHHHTTAAAGNTAASSSKASSANQSTSSQGGAGTTNTVPLIGMLFLGLLGI